MTDKAKSWIQTTLKVTLAGLLIWWIFSTGKIDVQSLKKLVSPFFVIVGAALVFCGVFAGAHRWRIILSSQGESLSLFESLRLTFIGLFFNFAMPGGVGGDVVKAYYLFRERPQVKAAAITSVLMDRIIGLYGMICMALLVMLLDSQHVMRIATLQKLFYFLLFLFATSTAFLYVAFSSSHRVQKIIHRVLKNLPFNSKLVKLYESTHLYGKHPWMICKAIGLSLIAQTFSIVFLIFAGEATGLGPIPYSTYFIVAPLGFMATAVPISPAGLGVGQAAFYALFNIYLERTTAIGPTVITALQAFQILFGLVGAGFYLFKKTDLVDSNEYGQTSL